ncbi:IS5/IS1182 family transposase [Candidatus Pacearchaeota archaeon CG10_big_fil_rev_8_21_14_0_10_34_12]|nr:MAG: IS5/IS1182 family transposase [Candidatus Pacearchaeota archaeon CG10_big_fil_rev_8_21_14_0_10_34_12]
MIAKQKRWGKKVLFVRDWKNVNELSVLKATFYLDFDWIKSWGKELSEMNLGKRGTPYKFPNSLIKLQAVWLNFFSYRGAEGITRKFAELGLLPEFNDYSTIQRRVIDLELEISKPKSKEISVATDGSGIKMNMSGEYFEQMYGKGERKKFIKVVISADPFQKDILKVEVSLEGEGASEPDIAQKHMNEIIEDGKLVNKFFGDGSFDKHSLFDFCDQHRIKTVIKIGKNANPDVEGSWKRSVEVRKYKKLGYKKWAKQNEYGRRWTGTEGIFSAVKKIYGERVRAHRIDNMCLEAKRKFWAYQLIKRYAEEKIALGN